jgi:hypothetical protein
MDKNVFGKILLGMMVMVIPDLFEVKAIGHAFVSFHYFSVAVPRHSKLDNAHLSLH